MLQALSCPEGGSISCSILEVAQAVSDGPSWFDWLVVGAIPLISALASIGVLIFSVRTVKSAERQAERSEAARIKSESDRCENERKQRFNAALAGILAELPRHLEALSGYERSMLEYTASMPLRIRDGQVFPPLQPSAAASIVQVGVAELDATPEESTFLQHVKNVFMWTSGMDASTRRRRLTALPELIVHWNRGGKAARALASGTMEQLAGCKKIDDVRTILARYSAAIGSPVEPEATEDQSDRSM